MIEEHREFGFKVRNQKPPVWDAVIAVFQVLPKHVFFTYGDTIYNPSGVQLREDIVQHESVHMEQQGYSNDGAALWWGKFLRDPEFRLQQEIEAYAHQYAWYCGKVSDRNMRVKFLNMLTTSLSGPMYGHCITKAEADEVIKEKSGV